MAKGQCKIRDFSTEEVTELRRQVAELAHVARLHSLGEMIASIVHQLGQPLGAIMNYAEVGLMDLQVEQVNRDELRDDLEHIVTLAERVGAITARLREFVCKPKSCHTLVDVNAVVKEAMGFIEANMRQSEVQCGCELAPGMPEVLADPTQIQQVILSLVRNAIEAMTANPVSERQLIIRTSMPTDGHVEVVIGDTGPGMPAELINRSFEPFFTTKAKALGIGLAVSRFIVESHGSHLSAKAKDGGGMTFQFTLPVYKKGKHNEARGIHCVLSG